ncbi:MAG: response regulator [Acidobacteria bacterium]|nr:response regulator [Acidobacteriota bacterium]
MLAANKECPVCQNHHNSSGISICPQSNHDGNDKSNCIPNKDLPAFTDLATLKTSLKLAALNNDIKNLRQTYLKLAQHFLHIEDLSEALLYFHKAELLEPNNLVNTSLKEIISIHIKLGQMDKTIRPIQQLAQLYVQSEETQAAKEYFENLLTTYSFDLNWLREVFSILDENALTVELSTIQQEKSSLGYSLQVSVATDETDDEIPFITDLVAIEEESSAYHTTLENSNLYSDNKTALKPPVFDLSESEEEPFTSKESPIPIGNKFVTPKEMPKLPSPASRYTTGPLSLPTSISLDSSQEILRIETKPGFASRATGSFRPIERPSFKDLSVMVVDDDAAVRELLVELLKDMGCQVIEAIDGQEAIEKLREVKPNFIISDIVMPRRDGYGLFEYLQSDDNLTDIPFIFLTGRIEMDEKLQALQGGVEDYWLKPFDIEEIGIRLRRMLQKARMAGDVRGKLSEIPLPDLLQSLAAGNKSGVLRLSRSGRYGIIYIDQGRIIDAEFEDLAGKTAIYCLVNWCMDGGNFNFHSQLVERNTAIKQSIQGILMEAMRRRDEELRLIEQLPPGDVFMSVNIEDNPEFFSSDFSDETMRILQLFDGTHSLSECLHCLQGDLETIQTVVALNKAGLLRIVDFAIE